MKKIIFFFLVIIPCSLFAQFGIKAGINFANITNAADLNSSNRSGFHAGILFGTSSQKIIGSRTELLFSRQGYNYKTNSNTGNVNLDYITLSQLIAINITKYFQLQAGMQVSYLLNAKADSSHSASLYDSLGLGSLGKAMDVYNRFDYGICGGFEVHPLKGLLIGARINLSFGKLYKEPENGQMPSFLSSLNARNNVVQAYIGWQFGKKK